MIHYSRILQTKKGDIHKMALNKKFLTRTGSNRKACSMMSIPHHKNKALSPLPYLPDGRAESQPRERESTLSPSQAVFSKATREEKQKKSYRLRIHEQFVALTGAPRTAITLEQLFHESQKVSDRDLYEEEEKKKSSYPFFRQGWFNQPNCELLKKSHSCLTPASLRQAVDFLVKQGWVRTRVSRTRGAQVTQYRVNVRRLRADLSSDLPCFSTYGM